MERPSKRQKIEDPDRRFPHDTGSQMAEGLLTSETAIREEDADSPQPPTITPAVELSPFERRAIFGERLHLQKRAEETVTVAASEVVVNVNDGTSTLMATTIPTVSADTILSLSDLGSVTIPANLTSIPTVTQSMTGANSSTTTTESSTSSTTITSSLSSTSNGTLTDSITNTVTVTETSTIQISFLNGTFFPVVVATLTADESSIESEPSPSNTAIGIIVTEDDSGSAATSAAVGDGASAGGATVTSEAPAATSSESSGGGGGVPTLSPQQQQVVGGVVGSIAGVALILVFILFLLRRYRSRLKAQGRLPEQIAERNMLEGGEDPPSMSHRSSAIPLTATLAHSLRKFRPYSSQTQATDFTVSTVPESERGFQRIAGRKIAPVLSTGGDGYGGDYGAFSKETGAGPSGHERNESSLADSSFYRDSRGFYGGRGPDSPTYPPSPTIGTAERDVGPTSTRDFAGSVQHSPSHGSSFTSRPEGTAALRPSPARTPVTISPAPSSIRLPIQQPPDMTDAPPMPTLAPGLYVPDGVGRTLASQDGSRISARSRGSGRSRFAENV